MFRGEDEYRVSACEYNTQKSMISFIIIVEEQMFINIYINIYIYSI